MLWCLSISLFAAVALSADLDTQQRTAANAVLTALGCEKNNSTFCALVPPGVVCPNDVSQVQCDEFGFVTRILIEAPLASGATLAPEIAQLTQLIDLTLQNSGGRGFLVGSIAALSALTRLEVLQLPDHALTGDALSVVSKLTALRVLRLGGNRFEASSMASLTALTDLRLLDLSRNRGLSGSVGSLSTLSALEFLSLGACNFTGALDVSGLTNLTVLEAHNNSLSGSLPALGALRKLEHVRLAHNAFSGAIGEDLAQLTSLVSLRLEFNQLRGQVPRSLAAHFNVTEPATCHIQTEFDTNCVQCMNITVCECAECTGTRASTASASGTAAPTSAAITSTAAPTTTTTTTTSANTTNTTASAVALLTTEGAGVDAGIVAGAAAGAFMVGAILAAAITAAVFLARSKRQSARETTAMNLSSIVLPMNDVQVSNKSAAAKNNYSQIPAPAVASAYDRVDPALLRRDSSTAVVYDEAFPAESSELHK